MVRLATRGVNNESRAILSRFQQRIGNIFSISAGNPKPLGLPWTDEARNSRISAYGYKQPSLDPPNNDRLPPESRHSTTNVRYA